MDGAVHALILLPSEVNCYVICLSYIVYGIVYIMKFLIILNSLRLEHHFAGLNYAIFSLALHRMARSSNY
jgi:hypothetical protein